MSRREEDRKSKYVSTLLHLPIRLPLTLNLILYNPFETLEFLAGLKGNFLNNLC